MADIIISMIKVEDFVRLMVGEAIRGEARRGRSGYDLFTTFQSAIADWISTQRPDLTERTSAAEIARLLCAMVVGLFVQYAAGVLVGAVGGRTDRAGAGPGVGSGTDH